MRRGKYARARRHFRHAVVVTCALVILGAVGTGIYAGVSALQQLPVVFAPPLRNLAAAGTASLTTPASALPESQLESRSESESESESDSKAVSSEAVVIPPIAPDAPDYQRLFPELYVNKPEYIAPEPGKKIVYLTFDDGPSGLTIPLLDVLDKYDVDATFFVVGKTGDADLTAMKEIVKRGSVLAIHSYTHDYPKIYASVEAFLTDFKKMRDLIFNTTGTEPTIFRFPGGSVNGYNKKTANAIVAEMTRRGYTYYDWNIDSGDATSHPTAESIFNSIVTGVKRFDKSIVLCHNTSVKKYTLSDMPRIIETLQSLGCTFDVLSPTVEPVGTFPLPKK